MSVGSLREELEACVMRTSSKVIRHDEPGRLTTGASAHPAVMRWDDTPSAIYETTGALRMLPRRLHLLLVLRQGQVIAENRAET